MFLHSHIFIVFFIVYYLLSNIFIVFFLLFWGHPWWGTPGARESLMPPPPPNPPQVYWKAYVEPCQRMFTEFASAKYPEAVADDIDKSSEVAFNSMRAQLLKEVGNVALFLQQVWVDNLNCRWADGRCSSVAAASRQICQSLKFGHCHAYSIFSQNVNFQFLPCGVVPKVWLPQPHHKAKDRFCCFKLKSKKDIWPRGPVKTLHFSTAATNQIAEVADL